MEEKRFPGGVWPVMLTPFTEENQVDYAALKELVEWYIKNGVDGLFAVCQSSEMFKLTLEERVTAAAKVKEYAAGRVPVIASGHISDSVEDQIEELNKVAATGVDAVILITNRMAKEEESDDVWIKNTQYLLEHLPEKVHLGLYECPFPYKRVMTPKVTKWCASTGRFYFLKDTWLRCRPDPGKIRDLQRDQVKTVQCQYSYPAGVLKRRRIRILWSYGEYASKAVSDSL